jgi:PAZ domain
VVITEHNTRQYQTDDITFEKTPKNHFFKWRDNGVEVETNMVDYFQKKYKIRLIENQPMLVVNQRDGYIYLPTELCHSASLPADFTKDFRKVRNLQQCKISHPNDRHQRISTLMTKLKDNLVFDKWNLDIQPSFTGLKGNVLMPPKVLEAHGDSDWANYEGGRIKHTEPIRLQKAKWGLAYSSYDYDLANELVSMLGKASGRFGAQVDEPEWCEI